MIPNVCAVWIGDRAPNTKRRESDWDLVPGRPDSHGRIVGPWIGSPDRFLRSSPRSECRLDPVGLIKNEAHGPPDGILAKSQISGSDETPSVDDQRFGTAIRSVRIRRGWRQADLAAKSGVSKSAISRLERGHLGPQSLDSVRAVAAALEIRVELLARWRAGDLDRLLNARHSALHESVARWFRTTYPSWVIAPEVSFAIYSDRGVVDILAWHPGRRALLIIELKTDIADVNELLGTLDRKRRVAPTVARSRDWDPLSISTWLIVATGRTNRRRIEAHRSIFRGALPQGGRAIQRWLRDPVGRVDGLSYWAAESQPNRRSARASVRRVSARRCPSARSGT